MRRFALHAFFAVLALAACGQQSTTTPPPLFKVWTNDTSGANLDLSTGSIGTFSAFFDFANGARCTATIIIGGDGTTGTGTISNAVVSTGTDPGCAAINGSYTYTVADPKLTLCKGAACSTYHK